MSENNSAVKATKTIHDMTTGSPAKLIVQFMIPMFLGNIFQQFYNVADSIIAGQFLGVRALAAIGSTGSLMFFVTGWLNGLSSGFAILVSQWFGAKQYDRMRHYVAMSVYLALGFALLMTIGFGFANEPILRLMNYSDQIMPDVKAYMGIIYAGLIVTAAYNSLAAFLRALGDSKSPLYFLIISAVINVALDVAFIIFGGMGVEGCAYATVIAQGISAVLCLIYIIKKFPILHLKKEDFKISLSAWGRLLALGIPMALQFSITAIGTIIVQGAINVYGENAMAGFSAASKLQNIIMTVFVAFGATIATYVGQNRGAGKMDRVRQGVRCTQFMIWGYSIFAHLHRKLRTHYKCKIFLLWHCAVLFSCFFCCRFCLCWFFISSGIFSSNLFCHVILHCTHMILNFNIFLFQLFQDLLIPYSQLFCKFIYPRFRHIKKPPSGNQKHSFNAFKIPFANPSSNIARDARNCFPIACPRVSLSL